MRIGFDVSFTTFQKTGCGWYVDSLIREMIQQHPAEDYTLYHQFGRNCHREASLGITLEGGNVKEPYRALKLDEALREWSRIENGGAPAGAPDVVQANFFECPRVVTAPVVYVVYDLSFWVCPEFLTGDHLKHCTEGMCRAMQNAAGFIFISQHTQREFEMHFPDWLCRNKKRQRVIHLAARHRAVKCSAAAGAEGEHWLFVSSIEPRKNLLTLLEAHELYRVRSRSPRKLLLVGGKGWNSARLHERIAKAEAGGTVQYLGYVPEDELDMLYSNACALVYPSYYEGFGLPILEAMVRGAPVICSRSTSHPEVGDDAVVYFDTGSPADLADKMLALENSSEARNILAAKSLERAAQFSWKKVADQTIDFYKEVIAHWSAEKKCSPRASADRHQF